MDAKAVVRADALFEAGLGLVLLVGGATGLLGAGDFPAPVGRAVIVAVGLVLLAVAGVLSRGAVSLLVLAAGNAATALAAVVWLVASNGFSRAGAALLAATAGVLVSLAAGQVGVARRGSRRESAARLRA
jgi:hypothetical protein